MKTRSRMREWVIDPGEGQGLGIRAADGELQEGGLGVTAELRRPLPLPGNEKMEKDGRN